MNASGVWADAVRALDEGRDPHAIRPAKGVHVTVPASRLPCDIAAVIPVPKDKRSIFVVSWPETDLVYLGTTDTDYHGPLDDPACTPEDVDYLLDAANAITTSRPHPGRRDRGVGGPAPTPGATGQGRSRLGANGGPLASPHGQHVDPRGGDRHRGQADDVPQNGPGHRRRRRDPPRRIAPPTTLRHQVPPAHGRHDQDPRSRHAGPAPRATPPSLRDSLERGAGPGRRTPGAARADRGRAALHGRRGPVRRPRGDGRHARRRAVTAHAGHDPARPAHHGRRQPRSPPSSPPDMGWDEAEAREQVARFTEACQKELLTAGLDLP